MRRHTRKQLPKLIGYGAALTVCAAGFAYAALQSWGKAVPDEHGCFTDVPRRHVLVLVDGSEPRWNEEQARSLRRYFDRLYEGLDFNERLSVFTSEGDQVASVAAPRFHVCGPARTPEELTAAGAEPAQAGYLKRRRARLHAKVLAPALEALLTAEPDERRRQRRQSPVLELIADLSRLPALTPGSRLIIVSDLIQNSDSARFCRRQNHMPRFSVFKKRRIYGRLKPQSLAGVQIEVLLLQRPGYGKGALRFCYSEEELTTFWREYFRDNGAGDARFIRIRHGIPAG